MESSHIENSPGSVGWPRDRNQVLFDLRQNSYFQLHCLNPLLVSCRLHSQIFTKDHSHPAWNNLFQLLSAFQDLLLFSIPNLTPTETGGTSSKSTGVGAAQVGSARGVQGDVDVVVRKRIGVEEDTKGEEGDVVVVLNERILSRVSLLIRPFFVLSFELAQSGSIRGVWSERFAISCSRSSCTC